MAEETTTIVIMGVTGDLARRKLLPALFQLGCKGRLPEGLRVVGFARRDYSDDQFREFMWDGVQEFGDLAVRRDDWAIFARQLFYVGGNLDIPEDFIRLRQRLQEMEGSDGTANRLFYLSIGPQLFGTTVKNLGASGLAGESGGWRRVVIEKPFGKDLESAQSLNRAVHEVFEEQGFNKHPGIFNRHSTIQSCGAVQLNQDGISCGTCLKLSKFIKCKSAIPNIVLI